VRPAPTRVNFKPTNKELSRLRDLPSKRPAPEPFDFPPEPPANKVVPLPWYAGLPGQLLQYKDTLEEPVVDEDGVICFFNTKHARLDPFHITSRRVGEFGYECYPVRVSMWLSLGHVAYILRNNWVHAWPSDYELTNWVHAWPSDYELTTDWETCWSFC
jgi:hypothetical protein